METGMLIDIGGSAPGPTINGGSQEVLSKAAEQMKQLNLENENGVVENVEVTSNNIVTTSNDIVTSETSSTVNGGTVDAIEKIAPPDLDSTIKKNIVAESVATPPSTATGVKNPVKSKPSPPTTAKTPGKPGTATTPTDKKPRTPFTTNTTISQTKSKPSKQTNGDSPTKTANSAATKKGVSPATTPSTARTKPVTTPIANPVASARAAASARRSSAPPPSQNSPATAAGAGDASTVDVKKISMNKVKVGNTPSPNIKEVSSKIGSLASATHRAGGGHVKIGSTKLNWKAESKIGSLSNVGYQPAGGNVKVKTPVESKKVELKCVSSKIGSLQNVKHKAAVSEKKIFDDKEYLKQVGSSSKTPSEKGGSSIPHSPTPREDRTMTPKTSSNAVGAGVA